MGPNSVYKYLTTRLYVDLTAKDKRGPFMHGLCILYPHSLFVDLASYYLTLTVFDRGFFESC